MTIRNIWILPAFISFYSFLTLLTCVLLLWYTHHIQDHWPYISDFSRFIPSKNVFGIMSNHILCFLTIWMYLKHRQLKSYYKYMNNNDGRYSNFLCNLSLINFIIGLLAVCAFQLAVNFPSTKVKYLEAFGNLASLLLGLLYIWIHSILSLLINDKQLHTSLLFLVRISLSTSVLSFCIAMLRSTKVYGNQEVLSINAIYEWCCYFAFFGFLLTDSYEFRNMIFRDTKILIRGCVEYNPGIFENDGELYSSHDSIPSLSQRFVR